MNLKKGFTLIELLVVIAIIGILSSVVLASLNSARQKGGDAAIKANLNGIRAQAELYYDTNGNYGTQATTTGATCLAGAGMFSNTNIRAALSAATAQAGTATLAGTAGVTIACAAAQNTTGFSEAWMVAVPLKSDSTKAFCVTSAGAAKEVNVTAIDGAAEFTLNSCQ